MTENRPRSGFHGTGVLCSFLILFLGGFAVADPTDTPTDTATNTATHTATNTPTNTPTDTPTETPTNTATNTPTNTLTYTATKEPTVAPSPCVGPGCPTNTPTPKPPPPTPTPPATATPTCDSGAYGPWLPPEPTQLPMQPCWDMVGVPEPTPIPNHPCLAYSICYMDHGEEQLGDTAVVEWEQWVDQSDGIANCSSCSPVNHSVEDTPTGSWSYCISTGISVTIKEIIQWEILEGQVCREFPGKTYDVTIAGVLPCEEGCGWAIHVYNRVYCAEQHLFDKYVDYEAIGEPPPEGHECYEYPEDWTFQTGYFRCDVEDVHMSRSEGDLQRRTFKCSGRCCNWCPDPPTGNIPLAP